MAITTQERITTQEQTNILKLVAGMFNAAPGAAYLNEFTDAYVAMNKDLGALAAGLGQRLEPAPEPRPRRPVHRPGGRPA